MDAETIVREVAENVRGMITEAEERAAAIVREAESEAEQIRARAESEARQRLAEVRSAFEELQTRFGAGAANEVEPGPVIVPEPEPPATPEPAPEPVPEPAPQPTPAPEPPLIPEPTPPPDEGTPPSAAGNGSARSDDTAGARLVAMNMALEGAAREQIEAKLAESYELADAAKLIDDVLALTGK